MKLMFETIFLCLFLVLIQCERKKRTLVYPFGCAYKFNIGLGVPVPLGSKQALVFGQNFQYQFAEPKQASDLDVWPPIVQRSITRHNIYTFFESILNKYGFDGQACVLLSICEIAQKHINHDENGLFGELIQTIFSPNYSIEDEESIYIKAQYIGEKGDNCPIAYPGCIQGYELINSILVSENVLF